MTLPDPAWNKTKTAYPKDISIQELFERQVAETPHAIALIDQDVRYSYTELNERANQMARVLLSHGMQHESIIGCYLTRSSMVVLCILAILKAGGTYLLLDAHMPKNRLEYIIADASPLVILYDGIPPIFSDSKLFSKLSLKEVLGEARKETATELPHTTSSASTANIAYTSGSTGAPKGVLISHRSTVNHACAFSKLFMLSGKDHIPLMAPIGFDMAIEEMIPPLVSGCALVVSKSQFSSMRDFNNEIIENGYTILNIPAPLWEEWVDYLSGSSLPIPPSIRTVIAGSEDIGCQTLAKWYSLKGADTVWWVAAYGTTETTVTSTFYTDARIDDLSGERTVPIGKPIANTYAYILDENMHEVPVGQQGLLYIGGDGVSLGYHRLDKLTNERFVADPFRNEPGARMYKTGDLVRYRADGNIVWCGRIDSQIKFYGLRVEPGDIEAVLDTSPFVSKSVVVLQQNGDREKHKHLVAFVVIKKGQKFHEATLRELAFRNLPTLMVPEKYIQLSELPLNTNGKTDRKVLEALLAAPSHS